MTQKERQARSRQVIFQAALEEFGAADFEAVTMDGVCAKHGISKGMLYHYYAGKDELFLACAGEIFQALHRYLQAELLPLERQPVFEALQNYFLLRETFFQTRPREKHVFENAVLYPPKHLADRIQALRQPILQENNRFLHRLLSRMTLREGVDKERAARYLSSIHAVFWTILERYCAQAGTPDLHKTLTEAVDLLQLVLYGVAGPEAISGRDA